MPTLGDPRTRGLPVVPATLRTLASDLRSGADVQALIGAFGRALASVPPLRGFTVEPLAEDMAFGTDHLTVPLIGSGGAFGTMKIAAGGSGAFRASRLQLAGALADLAAVMVDHALMARTRLAPAEMISVALADVPVGVLCFDGAGVLVCANPVAHHLLEGRVPMDWPAVWASLAPASRKKPGTPFVLRHGGRPVHVIARRASATGPGAVVLIDLAARIEAFGEVLSGEVYRCLVEKLPLSLGILAGDEGSPAAHEAIEAARLVLPAGTRVGPVDAEAVGFLVPSPVANALWAMMRDIVGGRFAGENLRGGVASLRGSGDTPGAFLARATTAMRTIASESRPGLLVCDRSPAVNDMLALVLRRDFSVTCSARWDDSLALLEEQSFDGLVLELPSRGDPVAQDFARRALGLQPAAQPFFVTDMPGPWETAELGRPDRPVFRKPFVVRDVRTAFKNAFTR